MPDDRKHRGPDLLDRERFSASSLAGLKLAAADLGWLLTRGYASQSSLKIVGDRYRLDARQRQAVGRCVASKSDIARRFEHRLAAEDLVGQEVWIDGFNVITSIEAALAGGVVLVGQDSTYRDMASMHGSYRKVAETGPAIEKIGDWLAQQRVARCHWFLDAPVSNSGRLKVKLLELAHLHGWDWQVDLVADPDDVLSRTEHIVASADSHILDHASRWTNLASDVVRRYVSDAWVVDFVHQTSDGNERA